MVTLFNVPQVQELEAEFERLPNEKPVQTRFMKSQQDLKAKIEEQQAAAASGGASGGELSPLNWTTSRSCLAHDTFVNSRYHATTI